MKQGDLVRYKHDLWKAHAGIAVNRTIYIVRWVEEQSNWVCVYGIDPPLQMSMMEVVSEGR